MNPVVKEYKGVIASASVALIAICGTAAFAWFAYQDRDQAIQLLKSKSDEINRFRSATPPPTKDHSKQLIQQYEAVEKNHQELRKAIADNDKFAPQPISPQDFQKALNERAQSLFKRADKDSVALPIAEGETNADSFFYLGFKEFKLKPPSPDKAPALQRQLLLTDLLLNLLLDNHPISIRKVRLFESDPVPPPAPAPNNKNAADKKKDSKVDPQSAPMPPVLKAQTFELQFSARPEHLRDFLNAVTSEKKAYFVPRNIKVVNSKEKEPPKKGETSPATATTNSPFQTTPTTPAASADNSVRYVLGDEYVDVELTLESLSVLPVTEETTKDAPKR